MTGTGRAGLTLGEAFDLPLSVGLQTAAAAYGLSLSTAYKLVRQGRFPCEVRRVGGRYRIATAVLMRSLGIEEMPVYLDDVENGAAICRQERLPLDDGP
ncbi:MULTISPECIES: helix-turn-helix domain-containing protein [Streptomyces]|uniref:helix-turn-helix domain-containing protein n=1 Tax=Streptomyces TaxID=1883 RepID=UPI0021AE8B3B|nr:MULTISPECIES: helix-turn-helix domain-containing protein [Streptomyces]GLX23897.1 hypothetical protein Slala01_75410 [Streptomyces lavendulae subsp. lavendulae]GLX31665.1 hypothetical protein Slala02_74840 [Streptomyces lavendulae subsp. lavendulae]